MLSCFQISEKFHNYKEILGRIVVVDCETTGLSFEFDNIIEIAGVEIFNGYLTGKVFHAYFPPRKGIEKEARNINKIDDYHYKNNYNGFYVENKKIFENFLDFCSGSKIICHNANFDSNFINKELNYHELEEIERGKFICSKEMAEDILVSDFLLRKRNKYSLKNVCEYFRIKVDERIRHTAFGDASLTAKLIRSICLEFHKIITNKSNSKDNSLNNNVLNNIKNENIQKIAIKDKENEELNFKKIDIIETMIEKTENNNSMMNLKKKNRPFEIKKIIENKTLNAKYFILVLIKQENFSPKDYVILKDNIQKILKPKKKMLFEYGINLMFYLKYKNQKKLTLDNYDFMDKVKKVKLITHTLKIFD